MNFTIIASGSRGNAYILDDGETRLLLECGGKWRDIQVALDFKISQLDACLITHDHGDHAKNWREIEDRGVPLFASAGTLDALGATGSPLKARETQRVGSYRIMPFEAVHDATEPLGWLIRSDHGGKLVFVTDTAYVPYRFPGLTHIAVEANYSQELLNERVESGKIKAAEKARTVGQHMSIDHALLFLSRQDLSAVECIYLLHVSRDNGDAEAFAKRVEAETRIKTITKGV